MSILFPLASVVFGTMLVEARRASRNERRQRGRGGIEPPDDVYRMMRWAYPLGFAAMLVEGALRGSPPPAIVTAGLALFALAKLVKWWAILSLGPFWTFRVIVVPGTSLIRSGPYRWLRHPNYVGVVGEFAGVALAAGAWLSGVAAITGFGWLLYRRIRVEERALATASPPTRTS